MKVFLRVQRKLQTGYNSFEIDLIPLTFCPDSLFTRLNGWSSSFTAFHISDSLIWAFIWLTDIMLNLFSREAEAVLILSLILELLRKWSILFRDSCKSFITLGVGSVSFHLIRPHICNPYLIFELNRLSATYLRPWGSKWFFILRRMNNLWFNAENTPSLVPNSWLPKQLIKIKITCLCNDSLIKAFLTRVEQEQHDRKAIWQPPPPPRGFCKCWVWGAYESFHDMVTCKGRRY